MAKSKDKSKKGGLAVRRVTKTSERNSGGYFMRLKTDDWMKGYALFTADPEAADNPGYFEYFEHYDKPNNQYVPCAGEDCYMCEMGDNPSPRALTLWYFPDNPEKEQLKVLKLNGYMIRDFAEIEAEEGGVLGRRFRVKRLSDKGEYRITPQSDKPLKKGEIAKLLKLAAEGKIDFEEITLRQLKAAVKKVEGMDALSDDDDGDEDDDETPKAKRGRPKAEEVEAEDDDEDDDDDSDDDEEDSDDDDDEDSDDEDEDEDDDSEDDDDEDDDSEDEDEDSEDSEDDEDDDENEADDEGMSGEKFTVVSTDESSETITVKIDKKNVKLWVGEGVEVDWDKVKRGTEITVDAEKDDEGDWVLTSLKAKKAGGKKK